MKNYKRGFTLIEILIALAIMGLIISLTTSLFMYGTNASVTTNVEYNSQAAMRVAVQKLNNSVRDASAAFALYKQDATVLSNGWNYVMLSTDKKSIVEYKWDQVSGNHKKSIIIEPQKDITYNISFKNNSSATADNLISYEIERISGSKYSRKISSTVESLNSLQVIDKAAEANKISGGKKIVANVLAFRADARNKASESYANVAMVLDTSGSMGNALSDGTIKLTSLKTQATNLITELSKNPNVNISLNPFSTSANNPVDMMKANTNSVTLLTKITNLSANGGTNTGDGMRRAYYSIDSIVKTYPTRKAKNFMIILVDGDSTFASVVNGTTNYRTSDGNIDDTQYTKYVPYRYYPYYYTVTYYKEIIGTGNTYNTDAKGYVDAIGKMIREYNNVPTNPDNDPSKAIKVYVIGFGDDASSRSMGDLAKSTTGDNTNWVKANSNAALKGVLDSIQADITDSLWHVGGPQ